MPSPPSLYADYIRDIKSAEGAGSNVSPLLVHCSAGIGRSGTFISIDICLSLIEIGKCSKQYVNIPQIVLDLRKQRIGMIQTPEQFRFVYIALMAALKERGGSAALEAESSTLRERKKKNEQKKKMTEKVMEMKRKLRESDEKQRLYKTYWKPTVLGVGILAAVGTVFYFKSR